MIAPAAPHPNQIAERLTGRAYTLWSAITTYQGCSLRYFYRYILGLPEDAVSASLVFGGSIHKAVETHLRERLIGNLAPTLDASWLRTTQQ